MSVQSWYRRMPVYLATPLAVLASAVVALASAVLGEYLLDPFLEKLLHRPSDLGLSLLVWFCAAPSIAIVIFVSSFSLMNRHHVTWRTPTFAFAVGVALVWVWARDFGGIGFAWYVPGLVAWLVCCWFSRRTTSAHSEHVIEA